MRRILMKVFLRLIGPIVLVYILYNYVDITDVTRLLAVLRWEYFGASVMLIPVIVLIRSVRWKRILRHYEIMPTHWECFRICFLSSVTTSVLPAIGSFIKVFYLNKKETGLSGPVFSVVGEKYIDFILPLAFGITGYVLISLNVYTWVSLPTMLLLCFILYHVLRCLIRRGLLIFFRDLLNRVLKRNWNVEGHIYDLERSLDLGIYFLSVIGFIVGGFVKIYLLSQSLSINMTFVEVVLATSIISVITVIPVSYLGIGTRDVGLLAAFQLFGNTREEAIALSMAVLLFRISFVFMGAIFWVIHPPPSSVRTKSYYEGVSRFIREKLHGE